MYKIINFQNHTTCDGNLISLEKGINIPFEIKRVYYIWGNNRQTVRGKHAHKKLEQVIICISGSCDFILNDGVSSKKIHLCSPKYGIYIKHNIWREFTNFSQDCIIIVLASELYDENDYIRDYNLYIKTLLSEKKEISCLNKDFEIKNDHHYAPIEGKYVNLREVEISDSAFILSLRCNSKKSSFLNHTENDLNKQIEYLKHYKTLSNEWYFIIEDKYHHPLGTSRIYNVCGKAYTGGSWLMKDGALPEETIEGALLARYMAFEKLGFEKDCFDVRKGNKKVIRFHKITGAKIVAENDVDYFFEITKDEYNLHKNFLLDILKLRGKNDC